MKDVRASIIYNHFLRNLAAESFMDLTFFNSVNNRID